MLCLYCVHLAKMPYGTLHFWVLSTAMYHLSTGFVNSLVPIYNFNNYLLIFHQCVVWRVEVAGVSETA